MKLTLASVLAGIVLLSACSTNPDGSVNWGDNPLNRVAGKIDDGLAGVNRAMDKATGNSQIKKGKKSRDPLDEPVYADGRTTYRDLLELGYIRKNPDYPKHADQPYVFTSLNCERAVYVNRLCLSPTPMIAPRP